MLTISFVALTFGLLAAAQKSELSIPENIAAITALPEDQQLYKIKLIAGLIEASGKKDLLMTQGITALVPTDEAIVEYQKTLSALKIESQDKDIDSVIQYQIMSKFIDLTKLDSAQTVPTQYISPNRLLEDHKAQTINIYKQDKDTMVSNGIQTAKVLGVVPSSNGQALIVDRILPIPGSVSQTLEALHVTEFIAQLNKYKMMKDVDEIKDLTMFVPTDEALKKAKINLTDEKFKSMMLEYHMVNKVLARSDMLEGNITAINGTAIQVAVKDNKMTINGREIVKADVFTNSGVIHVIDGSLTGSAVRLSGIALTLVTVAICLFSL